MKAEIKPRIGNDRTPLQDVIPLSTPYLVFLDPSSLCNAYCSFCPTGMGELKKYRVPGLMDWKLYKKIIDDLAAMPEPIKTLRLYKDGEPLLNPMFADMVRYAKETGRFGQVDTTTNGTLLTQQLSLSIIHAGLDKMFVSVPAQYSEGYLFRLGEFYNHSRGQCKIHVKIIDDGEGKEEKLYDDFGNICDSMSIEHLAPCWPGFKVEGVGDVGIYGQPIQEVQVCPYIFYSLAINSDGTVSLCFLDWKHTEVLGDIKKQSFESIWNGEPLRRMRIAQLQMKRCNNKTKEYIVFCRNCGQLRYGQPDDIDQYADEILGRLK